jgi:glycosyltransferase involved in cell wall biosynthesis
MSFINKKIIILGPAHPLRPGGITTFNERLCRALLAQGHTCSIWSFSLQYPGFLFPGSSQYTDAPAPEGISIHSKMNSMNPLNWIKVGCEARKTRPDLIIVRYWIPFMGPCLGTILRIARGNRHTRIVCIADNVIPHEKRPGDRLFTRYFTGAPHAFVVMSREVLQDLRQFTQKPARLLPHPLYDNFGERVSAAVARAQLQKKFGIPLPQDGNVLLFFGLVRHYKGLDLLLQALPLIKKSDFKLLIAGEFYDKKDTYTQLIEALQLQEKVILHPHFVADEDVKYFVCAANGIVQPYRSATQSGVTPVAYHFEVPMVVTNVGGLPQMVPHMQAGIVCQPAPPSIAAGIDIFFESDPQRFLPGLLQIKQNLSWDTFTNGIADLCQEIQG